MKQQHLIALGLAAVAVYMLTKGTKKTATGGTVAQQAQAFTKEIFNSAGRAFDNGWRYFSDGTAIDPGGNYYTGGQLVWSNPGGGL